MVCRRPREKVTKTCIEATVLNSLTPLSKAEICKILSPTTVEAVLGAMVKDSTIQRIGAGRASKYLKA